MAITKETILSVIEPITKDYAIYEHREQLTITVPKASLVEIATALRDNSLTQFNSLVDCTAIDWYDKKPRFNVVYMFYSIPLKGRVRLKVELHEEDLHSPTLSGVFESANWYEREAYDMYGVIFDNHPDLRRFYMPEDFADPETGEPLYPLRKDFPLMGVPGSLPLPPYPEKYGEVRNN